MKNGYEFMMMTFDTDKMTLAIIKHHNIDHHDEMKMK